MSDTVNGVLELCYNRGCGKTFNANNNNEGSCTFHPGVPVFHDAYKGWSCCSRKCTDFTEFLNIKGCMVSCHNGVKPPQPEKCVKSDLLEVIEYKTPSPIREQRIVRPSFDTTFVELKPDVSATLLQQIVDQVKFVVKVQHSYDGVGEIPLGTTCKNNTCKTVYDGPDSVNTTCTHHPGYPVFHEGLKFWTCCTRRTTDFNTFLQQVGCTEGSHTWFKQKVLEIPAGTMKPCRTSLSLKSLLIATSNENEVRCRLDWHQTATHVIVSIFAKKYDPDKSSVSLSPVRLKVILHFSQENGQYTEDMELRGVVDVGSSKVSMLPTKVEVKLRKAEVGSWPQLYFPNVRKDTKPESISNLVTEVDAVDLSDL